MSVRRLLLISVVISSLGANSAWAVSESRLWLPKKLKNLMPRLLSAAQLAEQRSDCLTVVRGELATDRSKPGVPVFRIVCRNELGLTYAMHTQADESGNTSLDASGPKSRFKRDWVQPIEEERGWRICLSGTRTKVATLIKPEIITEPKPRPDINKLGESYFYIDLDAQAISGDALKFGAMCKILPSGQFTITVAGRSRVVAMRKTNQTAEVPAIPVDESDNMTGKKAVAMMQKPGMKKARPSKASAKATAMNKPSQAAPKKQAMDDNGREDTIAKKMAAMKAKRQQKFKTEQGSRAGWQRIVPDMEAVDAIEESVSQAGSTSGWELESSSSKPARVQSKPSAMPAASKKQHKVAATKPKVASGWQLETSETVTPQKKVEAQQSVAKAKPVVETKPVTVTADGWSLE